MLQQDRVPNRSANAQPPASSRPTWDGNRKRRLLITALALYLCFVNVVIAFEIPLAGTLDFSALYTAGKLIAQGQGRQLFDVQAQTDLQDHLFPSRARKWPLLYYHPAYEALLFVPLSHLEYTHAYLLWLAVNLAMLLAVASLLRAHLPISDLSPIVILFAFYPVPVALSQGQDSVLLLLLFFLAFIALRRGQDARAGVLIALGLFKFNLVLPFAIALIAMRRAKALAAGIATATVLVAFSVWITGVEGSISYGKLLLHTEQLPEDVIAAYPNMMPNLRGFLTIMFSPVASPMRTRVVLVVASIAIVSALVWVCRRSRPLTTTDFELQFALAIVTAVLVSYHLNLHDWSLLILPLLILLQYGLRMPPQPGRRWLILIVLLPFATPLYVVLMVKSALSLLCLPLLTLGGAAWWTLRREGRAAAPDSAALERKLKGAAGREWPHSR